MSVAERSWADILELVRQETVQTDPETKGAFLRKQLEWRGGPGEVVRVRPRAIGDELVVEAMVVDPEGFCGFFRRYETDVAALISDLYVMAQIRNEDASEIGVIRVIAGEQDATTNNDGADPRRMWRLHLFACIRQSNLVTMNEADPFRSNVGYSGVGQTRTEPHAKGVGTIEVYHKVRWF